MFTAVVRLALVSALFVGTLVPLSTQVRAQEEAQESQGPSLEELSPDWQGTWDGQVKPALDAGLEAYFLNDVASALNTFISFERQRQLLGVVPEGGDAISEEGWSTVGALMEHGRQILLRECAESSDFGQLGTRTARLVSLLREQELLGYQADFLQTFKDCAQVGLRFEHRFESTLADSAGQMTVKGKVRSLARLTSEGTFLDSPWVLEGQGPLEVLSAEVEAPCPTQVAPPDPGQMGVARVEVRLAVENDVFRVQSVDALLTMDPLPYTYSIRCPGSPVVPQIPSQMLMFFFGLHLDELEHPYIHVQDWTYTNGRAFASKLYDRTQIVGGGLQVTEHTAFDLIWHPEEGGGDFGI